MRLQSIHPLRLFRASPPAQDFVGIMDGVKIWDHIWCHSLLNMLIIWQKRYTEGMFGIYVILCMHNCNLYALLIISLQMGFSGIVCTKDFLSKLIVFFSRYSLLQHLFQNVYMYHLVYVITQNVIKHNSIIVAIIRAIIASPPLHNMEPRSAK